MLININIYSTHHKWSEYMEYLNKAKPATPQSALAHRVEMLNIKLFQADILQII